MGARRRKVSQIAGQWVSYRQDMLESAAFRALGAVPSRILHRLEVEHMRHGGQENGRIPCTYNDFEQYGIRRKSVPRAIKEAVALGFLIITERGRMAAHEFRVPSRYRLTYISTLESGPTDEWARIKTDEQAVAILNMLEATRGAKKQKTGGEIVQFQGR